MGTDQVGQVQREEGEGPSGGAGLTSILEVTRDEFIVSRDNFSGREDRFARTFVAKADTMGLWPLARGVWVDGVVAAAIVVRVSKRRPLTANLQLLHTFSPYRRHGLASLLIQDSFSHLPEEVEYFRVSSEPDAIPFYRSLGFRFWGEQKSGTLLSIFRISGPQIKHGIYSREDPIISSAVNKTGRGGVVNLFEELL